MASRQTKSSRSYPLLNDEAWLRQKYVVEEKIMREVAELAGGCSTALVLHALRRYGIESRKGKAALLGKKTREMSFPQLYDREWLAARRLEGMGGSDIARQLGCSITAACKAYRRFDIDQPSLAHLTQSEFYGQSWRLSDEQWLTNEYILKRGKAKTIAALLKVSVHAVYDALSKFGIVKTTHRTDARPFDPGARTPIKESDGYVKVYMPSRTAADKRGWAMQHRILVEDAIGRDLREEEQVHHLNEKRDDNRLENLMLMPNYSEHNYVHQNPPHWTPRCVCCNRHRPELLAARPSWVPLVYDKAATYCPVPAGGVVPVLESAPVGSCEGQSHAQLAEAHASLSAAYSQQVALQARLRALCAPGALEPALTAPELAQRLLAALEGQAGA